MEPKILSSIPFTASWKGEQKEEKEISDFAQIKSISDLERASFIVIWQNFERLAAYIFEKMAEEAAQARRMRIDVII